MNHEDIWLKRSAYPWGQWALLTGSASLSLSFLLVSIQVRPASWMSLSFMLECMKYEIKPCSALIYSVRTWWFGIESYSLSLWRTLWMLFCYSCLSIWNPATHVRLLLSTADQQAFVFNIMTCSRRSLFFFLQRRMMCGAWYKMPRWVIKWPHTSS